MIERKLPSFNHPINISLFTGTVVHQDKHTSTEVHQESGAALIGGGYMPGRIYSTVREHNTVWVRSDKGEERQFNLAWFGLAARPGHRVTIAWAQRRDRPNRWLLAGARNHVTGEVVADTFNLNGETATLKAGFLTGGLMLRHLIFWMLAPWLALVAWFWYQWGYYGVVAEVRYGALKDAFLPLAGCGLVLAMLVIWRSTRPGRRRILREVDASASEAMRQVA